MWDELPQRFSGHAVLRWFHGPQQITAAAWARNAAEKAPLVV
jgi:hypothetical protein